MRYTSDSLVLETVDDVRAVIRMVGEAQRDSGALREYRSIIGDDDALAADLTAKLGDWLTFFVVLAIVEAYDVWTTGRASAGRRLFMGALACAALVD